MLIEKGDMKTANLLLDDASGKSRNIRVSQKLIVETMFRHCFVALFERAITTLLKDNQLLYFAYADFEEERMKYANVAKIYDRFIAIPSIDPTLVCAPFVFI